MSRSPIAVITVVGALGAVFAILTALLVARDERHGFGGEPSQALAVKEPRVRPVKEPRVRVVKQPRVRAAKVVAPAQPQPHDSLEMPDPRRESMVLNLDAYTEARSRQA